MERATAFVEGYGRTSGSWDFDGFIDLFSDVQRSDRSPRSRGTGGLGREATLPCPLWFPCSYDGPTAVVSKAYTGGAHERDRD